jgi:O-antigen/teichoic acid export membrane protein
VAATPSTVVAMTSHLDTRRGSRGDGARARAYLRDFVPAMAGYVLAITAVGTWGDLDGRSPWRYAWALLPVLPVLAVVRAVRRALRRADEYARLVQLSGIAVAFAATMVACVLLGMLAIAGAPLPEALALWVPFGVGMLTWAAAVALAARR